ncbi:hypothetical protein BZ163_10600 [Pseudomonas sp. VI4.1]|nr:hypothetical protein BZ163_10600 [Pseudomonas sp. VI4.1]
MTPFQTIDSSDRLRSNGGSSARNWLLPSINAHRPANCGTASTVRRDGLMRARLLSITPVK